MSDSTIPTQYWLAELDQYGNPKLIDGAHGARAGAMRALDITRRLRREGFVVDGVRVADGSAFAPLAKRYGIVRCEIEEILPLGHPFSNENAERRREAGEPPAIFGSEVCRCGRSKSAHEFQEAG